MARAHYLIVTQHFPSPESWRGSFVFDFACALLRTGRYRVSVFVPGCGPDYTLPMDAPPGQLTVHRFPRRALPSAILPFLFERANRAAFLARLAACGVRAQEVAVCHVHGVPLAGCALALKACNPRVRTLLHHHDGAADTGLCLGRLRHFAPHARYLYRHYAEIHAQLDEHVFVSHALERAFREAPACSVNPMADYRRALRPLRGLPPFALRACSVLPNGVNPALFSPGARRPSGGLTLGCVANFVPIKDHLTLLRALALAAPDLPPAWQLRLIGTGPTRRACERFIRRTRALTGRVHFEPERRHEEMASFYRALDLFVLPSRFEGFGCVYAEAAACGVPVIACAGQGPEDWLAPGSPALVPAGSPEALAERIVRFSRAPWPAPAPPLIDEAVRAWLPHLEVPAPPPEMCELILPVYRAERYLPEMLSSLRAQTSRAWRCLAVDDGSPDGCGEMLDAAARADDRFTVLHTPNRGVSAARNCALARARAPWVGFLDGDDVLAPGWLAAFEALSARCPQADLLRLRMVPVKTENYPAGVGRWGFVRRGERPEAFWRLCSEAGWSFLYRVRRESIGPVRFAEGLGYKEDALFYSALIGRVRALAWDDLAGYRYRLTPGSALRRARTVLEIRRSFAEMRQVFARSDRSEAARRAATLFVWGSLIEWIRNPAPAAKAERAALWRDFAELCRSELWCEALLERKFLPALHRLLRTGQAVWLVGFWHALFRWRRLRECLGLAKRASALGALALAQEGGCATEPLTLLINLERAPARLAQMRRELAGMAFERVTAVDGRLLARTAPVARFRFWLAHARRSLPVEIGCALSHQRAYARLLASSASHALVLEDDVRIDRARLAAALAWVRAQPLSAEPQVWLLHGCSLTAGTREPVRLTLTPAAPHAHCTAAYILNRPAATLLRAANGRVCSLADDWDLWRAAGLKVVWLRPFPCANSGAESSICAAPVRRATWRWYRALWQVRHACGSRLARVLVRVLT